MNSIWKIVYLKNAYQTLIKYDHETRKRIINSINKIPRGEIKKLQGEKYPVLYRLRVGKFQIIYQINETDILIVKIDTRGDVYK